MKVIVYEDDKKTQKQCSQIINNCIKEHCLNFELYLVTGEESRLLKTLNDLNETAIYFIDIVINGNPSGLDMIFKIADRNKSDFIIVFTGYPEKVVFKPEIKLRTVNIIFKQFPSIDIASMETMVYKEMSASLLYINEIIEKESENNFLKLIGKFNSILRVPYNNIIFIETYPKNRIKIHYTNGEFIYRSTIKDTLKQLDKSFIQCHQSYIINKHRVSKLIITEKKIIFDNGFYCFYSEPYKEKIKESCFETLI